MTLSTQLTRGTLALPMLALFAVLALCGARAEAEANLPQQLGQSAAEAGASRELAIAKGRQQVLASRLADADCSLPARPQLSLANAPADLGPLAQRQGSGCRA